MTNLIATGRARVIAGLIVLVLAVVGGVTFAEAVEPPSSPRVCVLPNRRRRRSGTSADQEGPTLGAEVEVFGHQVRRCQWWQRSTGRQCRKAALDGGDYCRTHGGNRIQVGAANKNYSLGRYSRLLPPSMRASAPPELHHRATIEVYDGRAEALLRRIAAGGGTWSEFADAYGDLRKAMFDANSDEIRFAMDKLHRLATGTAEPDALWKQFDSLMRKRAALVDSERRFALDARNVLTREQAQAHASALVAAIVKHVTDRDTLNAIMNDIRALLPMDE